jgi:hypothetical protein
MFSGNYLATDNKPGPEDKFGMINGGRQSGRQKSRRDGKTYRSVCPRCYRAEVVTNVIDKSRI